MARQRYVVLRVAPPGYRLQVATVQESSSEEDAACFNVGSHPDAQQRGTPYRVVVIPFEAWHEFEVFSNRVFGLDAFVARPSENPSVKPIDKHSV